MRYSVRAANVTDVIELVETSSPEMAIQIAQENVGGTFVHPAAISLPMLIIHVNNETGLHLDGHWYDCQTCEILAKDREIVKDIDEVVEPGYLWVCPSSTCGHLNSQSEANEFLFCQECGGRYVVAELPTEQYPSQAVGQDILDQLKSIEEFADANLDVKLRLLHIRATVLLAQEVNSFNQTYGHFND